MATSLWGHWSFRGLFFQTAHPYSNHTFRRIHAVTARTVAVEGDTIEVLRELVMVLRWGSVVVVISGATAEMGALLAEVAVGALNEVLVAVLALVVKALIVRQQSTLNLAADSDNWRSVIMIEGHATHIYIAVCAHLGVGAASIVCNSSFACGLTNDNRRGHARGKVRRRPW